MRDWGSQTLRILISVYLDPGLRDSSKMRIKFGEALLKKSIAWGWEGIFLTLIKLMHLLFGKGIILAAQALKFAYKWVPGDGMKIRFWEDIWWGIAPLAEQFWDMYYICHEKTRTIAQIWVVGEFRLTFRRVFSYEMMKVWDDLVSVVESLSLGGWGG
jgi:hypothetical protein